VRFDSTRQGSTAPALRAPANGYAAGASPFLAHDAARLMIGETLYVDGGYHIID